MTTWKEAAAQLGTSNLVDSLKALEGTMKKRDYKRLVSTTAAQLLELHPDVGAKKARRWVRRVTGTKPGKAGRQESAPAEFDESTAAAPDETVATELEPAAAASNGTGASA